MEPKLIYLASPYWHESELIRLARARMAKVKTAELLENGYIVYSPIAHNHEVSKFLSPKLLGAHDFWMRIDLPFLSRCDELWILTLKDWQLSRGVAQELEHAKSLDLPIRYIDYAESAAKRHPNLTDASAEGVRARSAPTAGGLD